MGIVEPQRQHPEEDLPPVQRDGTPRCGELLLRRREWVRDHASTNFKDWREGFSQDEVEADPRGLSGCPQSRN